MIWVNIKKKIISKFEPQLADSKHLNSPVILIIDNLYLSTTDFEIKDLLEGTFQFVVPFNNTFEKQKLTPSTTRANDSFNEKFESGSLLSAVILLRPFVDNTTLTSKLRGQIYENPNTKFPINKNMLEEFNKILFQS